MAKPSLALVNPIIPKPPRKLGTAGTQLWTDIQQSHAIDDIVGIELLFFACAAADRLAALAKRIDADGEVDEFGRPHSSLATEASLRNQIVRLFDKLGLNYEPLHRTPGRPPKTYGA